MTSINDLVKEKVELTLRRNAIELVNTYGKSINDLVELELDKLQTTIRLKQITKAIDDYANVQSDRDIHDQG